MTVLLIGAHHDPHVLAVATKLKERSHRVVVMDSLSKADFLTLDYSKNQTPEMILKTSAEELVSSDEISGIWLRQKPIVQNPSWGPLQRAAAEFSQGEWRTVLNSLQICCPNAIWVNDPQKQICINSKPRQLAIASELGMLTPRTIISNNPNDISAFIEECGRVIYKSLNWYTFPDQTGILTTELTADTVSEKSDAIKSAPGIYQQLIEKDYELRITVVGEKCFTALVRTPKSGDGAVDWRHAHFEDIFESVTEDLELNKSILNFHNKTGLRYGTYDFIVDKFGDKHFLECNPAGQYLWLENSLGLQISDAIACELSRGSIA